MLINVGGVLLFSWWRRRLDATITAGRFWPNPAIQASIVDCQIEHIAVAATGRNRPIAAVQARIWSCRLASRLFRSQVSGKVRNCYRPKGVLELNTGGLHRGHHRSIGGTSQKA